MSGVDEIRFSQPNTPPPGPVDGLQGFVIGTPIWTQRARQEMGLEVTWCNAYLRAQLSPASVVAVDDLLLEGRDGADAGGDAVPRVPVAVPVQGP